jgi:hypothetical protein
MNLELSHHESIYVWQRRKNLGIAISVISAIDWFFSFEEEGIILEDDLIFDDSFTSFCQLALAQYRNRKEIFLISGNQFNSSATDANSACFSSYPQTWGWATWRDRWIEYRQIFNQSKVPLSPLSLDRNLNFWSIGTNRVLAGDVDTWDIPLGLHMKINCLYQVQPPKNLVRNIGDDAHATHTSQLPSYVKSLHHLDMQLINLPNQISPKELEMNNRFLEQTIFRIRMRHSFLPLKVFLIKFLTNCPPENSLSKRLAALALPSKSSNLEKNIYLYKT